MQLLLALALSLFSLTEGIDVKFTFTGNPSKPLDIIAVLADDADRSNVLHRENSGRQLQHVSVARAQLLEWLRCEMTASTPSMSPSQRGSRQAAALPII